MSKEVQPYNDLDLEDIYHLAGSYNNYIMDFDYEDSGQPVSIYEFYQCEYQALPNQDN